MEMRPIEAAVAGLEPHRAAKTVAASVVLSAKPPFTLPRYLLSTAKISAATFPLARNSAIRMKSGATSWFMLVPWAKATAAI
jgi:hypothetical protein